MDASQIGEWLVAIAIAFVCAFLAGAIAHRRGRSPGY
jgi:hypothetical protein